MTGIVKWIDSRSPGTSRREWRRLSRAKRVSIGTGTYERPEVKHFAGDEETRLVIGNYCSIAAGVTVLLGGEHPLDRVSTFPFARRFDLPALSLAGLDYPASRGDVIVGSDVWIGHGATLLSGSTVGHGAVIAARAVVRGVVPPYAVVAGSPARVRRLRLSEDAIPLLLKAEWWNWPEQELLGIEPLLSGEDTTAFLDYVSQRGAANRQGLRQSRGVVIASFLLDRARRRGGRGSGRGSDLLK